MPRIPMGCLLGSILGVSCYAVSAAALQPQSEGQLRGRVTLEVTGSPVHGATVMLVQLSRIVETDADGHYIFTRVPSATYDVVAYTVSLTSTALLIQVEPGETAIADFELRISPIRYAITVTAKGREETAFETVQSVDSLDSFDLSDRMAPSIGEVLDEELGVAKRSFGPGSARPVVRGFDGDRVLVMQDGIRIGSLASQSGDHGEPINPAGLERLEVVKGPATLLYGTNAVGGVVNAVTGHHAIHQQAHQGIRGTFSSVLSSNNDNAGAHLNAEFGTGEWLFWVAGGGQRAGDYDSPEGQVDNSKTRTSDGRAGVGWFGERGFASLEYMLADGRYGIPFVAQFHGNGEDEELQDVDVDFRRYHVRFDGGFRKFARFIDVFRLILNYVDWSHRELEVFEGGVEAVGTAFDQDQFIYRGVFEQARKGIFSGSFGFWGMTRDYDVAGEEAFSPPVDQDSFAVFSLEELEIDRVKFQLGGRIEHTRYTPRGLVASGHNREVEEREEGVPRALPRREFTGFSAGVGVRFDLWERGAFVANYTNSYRAPALEELYNLGPHVGNLAFEVGNPDLKRERSNGLDFSLRHSGEKFRGEVNLFYYGIDDFVFLAPTGRIKDGLVEGEYLQGDARFVGTEFGLDVGILENIWLNLGLDAVDAELSRTNAPLPRIPPVRARFGLDFRNHGFSFKPELVMASRRDEIFATETPTAGYTVVNLKASYTLPRTHFVHHFSLNVFNVGDRLYRNHVSFIKDLAPEMGRGVRFGYAVSFF